MFEKILVAVDGSESCKCAADRALAMAKEYGSKVTAISVFDIDNFAAVARAYGIGQEMETEAMKKVTTEALSYIVDAAKKQNIKIGTKMIVGSPANVIIDDSKNYDLVICGTLGRTGIQRFMLGSVAEKVVRMAACPVLVCRSEVCKCR